MTAQYDALNRLIENAAYGIRTNDHELMNPENYKKEMHQHETDVKTIRSALTQAASGGWQDISTAPKNGTEILLNFDNHVMAGTWDDERHSRKPRPFWIGCKKYMGIVW